MPGMEPEYFEIVDGFTLRPIEQFEDVDVAVACTAVKVGDIRLIDNIVLKNNA
ncbi:MAG: pantoate--beta-alanine ligase [Saprospiraceae bacterium]